MNATQTLAVFAIIAALIFGGYSAFSAVVAAPLGELTKALERR